MSMKLKVGHVYQAAELITAIINQNRPMPQKGAYRLARLYAKLKPEYDLIFPRRNATIEAYDYRAPLPVQVEGEPIQYAETFSVPPDKMAEWTKTWAEIANDEIEVDVQPIPLEQLCAPNAPGAVISAAELLILDDLVAEG